MKNLTIKDWCCEDRPRQRAQEIGMSNLSNAELLSILIGAGTKNLNAVDLMREVLASVHNNLNSLGKLSLEDLMKFKGIGEAKATSILAACEIGKRRAIEKAEEREDLGSSAAIYNYMHPRMQDLTSEEFWILLMNQNFKLIKAEKIGQGGITYTAADIRIMMKEALLYNATVFACCHNHPSGSIHPSRPDDQLTDRIRRACDTMNLYFLDHVIITDGRYYSYREQDRI